MRLSRLLLVIAVAAPAVVHAQGAPPPPTMGSTPTPGGEAPKLWGGAAVELLPTGTLESSAMGMTNSVDAATAYALAGLVDYRVSPVLSVGFAPRYVLDIKGCTNGTCDTDSASALDLRGRVTARTEVAPLITLFGYGTVGYTVVFLPSSAGSIPNPSGFAVTVAAGVGYALGPRAMLTGELGYTLGRENTTIMNVDVSYHVDYLHVGAGVVFAIGQ